MYPIPHFQERHSARVTSGYGMRPDPFGSDKQVMHNGVDLGGVPRGHIWTSPYPGRVVTVGTYTGRGIVVVTTIQGTQEMQLFQHLDKALVKVGDWVDTGSPIGTNGTTGDVTGPHLHYEIRINNGTALGSLWGDPANYFWREKPMQVYTVKRGDTLGKIASAHGVTWRDLVEWNKDRYPQLADNPNLISVGWELQVSPPPEPLPDASEMQKAIKALEKELAKQGERIAALENVNKAIRRAYNE